MGTIGLDYCKLPKFNNGQLMALAETDRSTMHKWIYMDGELSEATLELMKGKLLSEFPLQQFGA